MTEPTILEYITANAATYTRSTITDQLVKAGHDPVAIEEAWATYQAQWEATHGPNPWPRFWKAFGLTALVGAVAVVVGWVALWGGSEFGGVAVFYAVIIYGIGLLVPMGLSALVVALARGRASSGTLLGMAAWVPIILVGLTAGTCIAIATGG